MGRQVTEWALYIKIAAEWQFNKLARVSYVSVHEFDEIEMNGIFTIVMSHNNTDCK